MPTKHQKHASRIAQLTKQLYIINYLLDHGASTYNTLLLHRPGQVKLRKTLVNLCQKGYISIHQDPITTPAGKELGVHQTYEVRHYPQALKAIQQWENELEAFKEMTDG